MIKSFFDRGTEDIFNRIVSKEARATCPKGTWRVAQRKLDQLNAVVSLDSLRIPPGNKLEALKGDRRGQYSIRIKTSSGHVLSGLLTVQNGLRLRIIIRSAPPLELPGGEPFAQRRN